MSRLSKINNQERFTGTTTQSYSFKTQVDKQKTQRDHANRSIKLACVFLFSREIMVGAYYIKASRLHLDGIFWGFFLN